SQMGARTSSTAAASSACKAAHQTRARCDGLGRRPMTATNALDECGDGGVVGDTAPHKVRVERGIGQVENRLERDQFGLVECRHLAIDEPDENGVELAHAAPRPPPEPRDSCLRFL